MFEALRELAAKYDLRPVHVFVSGARSPSEFLVPSMVGRPPAELADLVRSIGFEGSSVMADEDAARHMLPALRSDLEVAARDTYAPSGPIEAPITAFAGREDPYAPPDSMDLWRAHTSLVFSKIVFPGEHYFIVPQREALLGVHRG